MTKEMHSTDAQPAQVVIVGGGPVGMGLAIELGQRGIRCDVIEQYAQPQHVPKGQNLTQRTMEHFHFWGAENELRAARTIPREYGIGGLTAYGTLLSDYNYDWLQRELVRPFYFTDNERLPQYETEAVLRHRAAALPSVRMFFGWKAETLTHDDQGVTIGIAEREGLGRQMVRAEYAVGCDGGRSVMREQAGISQTSLDHDKVMVLLVFRSLRLHELLKRYPGKSYYNVLDPKLDGYWKFFGRVDLGSTWFFHAPVPAGTTKDNFDFREYLWSTVGAEFDVEFEHIGFWDLRIAIADHYRTGRVFIAGDAAHTHPPYGGYGINTGFEDATNLGWKLAASLQGWGGQHLLDSYEEERRPVFQSTARDFIGKSIETDKQFLATFDPVHDKTAFEREWHARGSGAVGEVTAFEPNYQGSSIVAGEQGSACTAVGSHTLVARAGHHLAPQTLSSGRNVFDELGDGFTLLGFDIDGARLDAFAAAANSLHMPLKIVSDKNGPAREGYEASLILIRPDQFVAWTADRAPEDATKVLKNAVGCDALKAKE